MNEYMSKEGICDMKVKDLMTSQVATAALNMPLNQVASQMRDYNVGSIPVCDRAVRYWEL